MACIVETEEDEKPLVDDAGELQQQTAMVKATKLSNKVRRRMYGRITSQLHSAQLRTKETVERLHFTVDLVTLCFISLMLLW